MLKKATTLLFTLALAMALTVTSFDSAEARRGRGAAIAGGVALGILALGAAASSGRSHAYDRGGGCYRGPRECRWTGGECFYDRWGDRVCRGGYRECYRPTYCD
jgi:hypothetical protein